MESSVIRCIGIATPAVCIGCFYLCIDTWG